MKNKIVYLLLVTLISFSTIINAQQPTYPVKVIDGVEYYIYTVEAGEGLYSISRRFGVTQADINNANPQIHDGLKAGQDILIPKKDEKSTVALPQISDEVEYVLHTVERRQTLFAISRKFQVSQDLIIQSNPAIRDRGLQPGDVLRIPVMKESNSTRPASAVSARAPKQTPVSQTQEINSNASSNAAYINHNVVQSETLYSISRKYNITVDELKRLNPETASGLKSGSVLRIPITSANAAEIQAAISGGAATRPGTTVASNPTPAPAPAPKPREPKTTYKIAYLLPFMANDQKDATAEKFIEFYMGSLLAINNAKNGDMNFEVYSFDTEKTETKLYEVINKPEMQEMDLIIGPAYTSQIPILADFAKRRQINTVIPFSSKVAHVQDNPYLFQFNPNQETQNEFIVNLLKNNFKNTHIVFVETGNTLWSDDGMEFFGFLKQRLDRQRIAYTSIKSADFVRSMNANFASDRKNIIIFDTDDYKTIHGYLVNLHDAANRFDVGVLGQYAWRNQSGKKPQMYYVSPFAGNKLGTQFYEQEFNKYYGSKLPIINPRYDLLGYDITSYFLSLMKRDGFTFNNSTQSLSYNRGVQSNFEFKRSDRNGGFVNQQLYLIEDEAVSK